MPVDLTQHRLLRPLSIRTYRRVGAVSLIISMLLVGAALPGRRQGGGNDTDVLVPFRPATAEEIAVLLQHAVYGGSCGPIGSDECAAVVVALHGDVADVVAQGWVDEVTAVPRPSYVSWNNFLVQHQVSRAALEVALGRALTQADVNAEAAKSDISFKSRWWWLYAAAEVAILTILGMIAGLAFIRVRPLLLLPLVFELWVGFFALSMRFFAPATWDTDFFFQRVIIDRICVWMVFVGSLGLFPALTGVAMWVGASLGGRLAPPERSHERLVRVVGGIGGLFVFLGSLTLFAREKIGEKESRIELVKRCIEPHLVSWAQRRGRSPDEAQYTELAGMLDAADWEACSGGRQDEESLPVLYLPRGDEYAFFMLFAEPKFIDTRDLEGSIGGRTVARQYGGGASGLGYAPLDWVIQFATDRFVYTSGSAHVVGADGVEGFLVEEDMGPGMLQLGYSLFFAIGEPR